MLEELQVGINNRKIKGKRGTTCLISKLQEKGVVQDYESVEEEWCGLKKWLLDAVKEAVRKKKCGEEKVGGVRKLII